LSFYSSPFHDEYCIKKEYLLVIRIGDSYLHTIGYSYLTIYINYKIEGFNDWLKEWYLWGIRILNLINNN